MGEMFRPEAVRPRRMANYELLRILSMLMVITLHYLSHTGSLLEPGKAAQSRQVAGTLIESFCIVAVNVYVLISGYFLADAGFRMKRVLVLAGQVLFYALAVPLVMLGMRSFHWESGWYTLVPYAFPLQAEHYWFATSYVLLSLFTPFLNTAVRHMSKRQMQIALAGLLFVFCGLKSVLPVYFVTDRFGYDFGWFLCVYLSAAYIRRHGVPLLNTAKKAWGCCVACSLLMFGVAGAAYLGHGKLGILSYYITVPFHYNYILCFWAAVALFVAFGYVKIPQGKRADTICRMSMFTFGVYLFHEHLDIRNEWVVWIEEFLGRTADAGLAGFLLNLAVSVAVVYLAGTFVDAVRLNVFRYIGRYLAKTRLAVWLRELDGAF